MDSNKTEPSEVERLLPDFERHFRIVFERPAEPAGADSLAFQLWLMGRCSHSSANANPGGN
jgi:hypothetical protein